MSLVQNEKFSEARDFAREQIPVATRSLGPHAELTRNLRTYYAKAILCDTALPLDDVAESVAIFEDIEIITRRIFGNVHPDTLQAQKDMDSARMIWRARFSNPFPSKLPRLKTNDAKHEELMRKFELAK